MRAKVAATDGVVLVVKAGGGGRVAVSVGAREAVGEPASVVEGVGAQGALTDAGRDIERAGAGLRVAEEREAVAVRFGVGPGPVGLGVGAGLREGVGSRVAVPSSHVAVWVKAVTVGRRTVRVALRGGVGDGGGRRLSLGVAVGLDPGLRLAVTGYRLRVAVSGSVGVGPADCVAERVAVGVGERWAVRVRVSATHERVEREVAVAVIAEE